MIGLALAWAYSAPPLRLKLNGWWGNAACAACYEGLPWVTGAAVMAGARPDWHIVVMAALYSAGAHGIMTLNDFKSVEGDQRMGIGSLPVRLGVANAARLACGVMALPQGVVIMLLLRWGQPVHAAAVALLLAVQLTADGAPVARSERAGALVQCDRHQPLCHRHAGHRICPEVCGWRDRFVNVCQHPDVPHRT